LNSAKDRRVIDGVSSRSKQFEPAPPQARSWPADNLSSDLSQQPQISNTSSRSEIAFELAHLWPGPRLAFKLNGGGTQSTHNYTGKFRAQTSPAPSHRTIITIVPAVEVNEQWLLQATFQERQIKTWQKN
jgi:hypothetical protein